MAQRSPLKTFISFSHHDIRLCENLRAHLSTLVKDEALIELWWDRDMRADEWNPEIMNRLDAADIILLLASAQYNDSDNCRTEYLRAMERHEALKKGAEDGAVVVPIWLHDFTYGTSAFGKLNPLPAGYRPIDQYPNKNEAFKNVAAELRDIVMKMNNDRKLPNNFRQRPFDARHGTANLLPHLCDRSELIVSLNQMWSETEFAAGTTRQGRPFVFVIYGYQDDCAEGFKSRLEYRVLPKLFKVDGSIVPIPVDWPEASSEDGAKDKFAWYVASRLDCQPADIPNRLPAPVNLFVWYFDYEQWRKNGDTVLRGFLKFWDTFPDIRDQQIVSCVIVRVPRVTAASGQSSGSGWMRKVFGKPGHQQNPESILDCLAAYSNVNLRALKLAPIKKIHVDSWVDEGDVRNWCRPQTENEMRNDLREEFSNTEEKPMGELVSPMQQALAKYKSTG